MTKSRWIILALLALGLALGAPAAVAAQKSPMYHFSFGASLPQGTGGDVLDSGFAIHGGASWFSPDRPIGIRMDLGVDWWDISEDFLRTIDTDSLLPGTQPPDDGDARVWQGNVNLIWNPESKGTVGFYVTAGVDIAYLSADVSEDGVAVVCDWYWCYTVGADYIVESKSSWEWGLNAGVGVTFQLQRSQLYLEAIYHWLDTDESAQFVPVSVGWRF